MSADLREFVSKTIEDVLEGVRQAQQQNKHLSGHIAPSHIGDPKYPPDTGVMHISHRGAMTFLKFDVAVTAEDTDTTKAGGGLKVAVLSLSASGEAATRNTAVTRVQFTVPVILPAYVPSPPAA